MKKPSNESYLWRWITNFWTIIIFLIILADFLHPGSSENIIGPIAAIYIAVLAIYSAEKEFERWHMYSIGRHPGEVYVFAWTALVVALYAHTYITHSHYDLPDEIFSTYIIVLGILAITRKSKSAFKETKLKK